MAGRSGVNVRDRGVLYIVSTPAKPEAQRSIESLQRAGLDFCVKEVDEASNISAKANMFELSPFCITLLCFPRVGTFGLSQLPVDRSRSGTHGSRRRATSTIGTADQLAWG